MRDLRAISSGREAKKSMANVIDRLSNGALAMMLNSKDLSACIRKCSAAIDENYRWTKIST